MDEKYINDLSIDANGRNGCLRHTFLHFITLYTFDSYVASVADHYHHLIHLYHHLLPVLLLQLN